MNEKQLTPRQIVHELDRYIVGQDEAKKAVAIALRNRYRRSRVSGELRDEIIPKMTELRAGCDEAETVTAADYWPFPT